MLSTKALCKLRKQEEVGRWYWKSQLHGYFFIKIIPSTISTGGRLLVNTQ